MVFKLTEDGRTYLDETEIKRVMNVSVELDDPVDKYGGIVTLRIYVDRVEMNWGFTE